MACDDCAPQWSSPSSRSAATGAADRAWSQFWSQFTLIGDVDEYRGTLASSATTGADGRLPLTPAELRLLPYLQTHLTARGIADRLIISRHTVESQVKSLYRKLGVSSRNDAVQRATAIGLLGD
jgi:LuxR family maltose regulon positive regulatory protein